MNLKSIAAGWLIVWTLPACSLIRNPEKTLDRVQARFVEASIEGVAEAKHSGGKESHLERVTIDPGRIGVGDLVVVRRIGEEGPVILEPVFSIERTIASDRDLSDSDKARLIDKVRRVMSHRTAFSHELEVSRRELGKVEDVDGLEALKDVRKSVGGAREGMRFLISGGMEELRPSYLEDVYDRIERGKLGGRATPGLEQFKADLRRQLRAAAEEISKGLEVYAVSKLVMVDSAGGVLIPGKKDEENAIDEGTKATAVAEFGKAMIPHVRGMEGAIDAVDGIAEYRRSQRYCWALACYRVSRTADGRFEVDPKKPMKW